MARISMMWTGFALLPGLCAASAALSQAAEPAPRFGAPVECALGTLCVVQNYVDQEPGPGARDHTCGSLAYDGHDGIDIRVPGYPEMAAGVAVVAAAPGVVRAARDGMPDVSFREAGARSVRGREAGNAVVIDHGGGWETQYSHLRRGSIRVEPGQRVAAGAVLGLIGLSGKTEFPHVHFAVRHDGRALDPYTGRPPESGCGEAGTPLWSAAAGAALAYRAGGILGAGFAAERPALDRVLAGAYRAPALPADAPALVFWALAWGLRAGDRETIRILGPDGAVLAETHARVPKHKAQWLRFTGRARKAAPWPPGRYRGEYRVTREDGGRTVTVAEVAREIEIE
ncbi:MAG: M23 family metallopeptidase [Kiloniellaceae bacterium]